MNLINGKLNLNGYEGLENPVDSFPLKRKLNQYKEWKESERTSFRSIWLERYVYESPSSVSFESFELKISNRGKCFIDDKEIKNADDISIVKEIFSQLKVE